MDMATRQLHDKARALRDKHIKADALSKTTCLYIDSEHMADRARPTDLQFIVPECRKFYEDELVKIAGELGFADEAELRKRQRILRQEEKRIDLENFNQVNLIRFNPGYNANTLVYEQGRDISVRAMIHIIRSDITDPSLLTTAMKPLTKSEKQ